MTSSLSAYRGAPTGPGLASALDSSVPNPYTPTAMSRWSILHKKLPAVSQIKCLHVYDFDNTLFKSPLPNPKIWCGATISSLSDPGAFVNGGWWHDPRILASTGEGVDKEEPRAWEGWWNEHVVELVRLSQQQSNALCVILTGRAEDKFAKLIRHMLTSKNLDVDILALRPVVCPNNQRIQTTMQFKQLFLHHLIETYKFVREVRLYDDRSKHVNAFRDFLANYNRKQVTGPDGPPRRIDAHVVHIVDISTKLDPVHEVAAVQQLVHGHNESLTNPDLVAVPSRILNASGTRGASNNRPRHDRLVIRRSVVHTAYIIDPADAQCLLGLVHIPPEVTTMPDFQIQATYLLISRGECDAKVLRDIGGLGAKTLWTVTAITCHENSLWAARLKPVPATAKYHTLHSSPVVVLAMRKPGRRVNVDNLDDWQPVPPDKLIMLETTIAEKVLLRVEPEHVSTANGTSAAAREAAPISQATKRPHPGADVDKHHVAALPPLPIPANVNSGSGAGRIGPPHQPRAFNKTANRGGARGGAFRAGPNVGGGHKMRVSKAGSGGGGGGHGPGPNSGPSSLGNQGRGGKGGNKFRYRSLDDVNPRKQSGYGQTVSYEDAPQLPLPPVSQTMPQQLQQQQPPPSFQGPLAGGPQQNLMASFPFQPFAQNPPNPTLANSNSMASNFPGLFPWATGFPWT